MEFWDYIALLSIPALVAFNGYFVASEFALVALRSTKVEEMVQQGVRRAKSVELATDNLDRSIAATQLGITLASIALGWVGEPALARLIEPWFEGLPAGWQGAVKHTIATTLAFAFITTMHVVFGELIPKSVALQAAERTSLWIAAPLNVFIKIALPIIHVMNGVSNLILKLIGFRPASSDESAHSVDELRLLIADTEEAGIIDEDQAEFVQNVFMLSSKTVADCMVPRDKIAALEINASEEKVLESVRSGAHTRMPVYEGEFDNLVGIVNTKDLFYLFSLRGVIVLEDAIYPATFLDPNESIANALRLLKKSHKPMAMVREASGRIIGMITLEDIIEQIVGDIEDEHDRPVRKIRKFRRRPVPKRPEMKK